MKELISIVVPIYNVEKYLERSIGALLNQTYDNLEIILVDDGSTDASSKMCDEFALKDARVKVIHKKNGGSSSARNVGIQVATGTYIGFSDSDDYTEKDMYQNLYKVASAREDAIIVQVMSSDYAEDGTLIKGPYRDSGETKFLSRDEIFRLLMLHVGDSSFCTKLIKADYMKQFRFQEGKLNEDFELLLRMLIGIPGVYSIEKNGYNIELRNGSNSRNVFRQTFYDAMITNSNKAYRMMEKEFPQYKEEVIRFCFFQRLDYLLHMPVNEMKKQNVTYVQTIKELRMGRKLIRRNRFLSRKEKRNLLILSYIPRFSKRCHGGIMKCKKVCVKYTGKM